MTIHSLREQMGIMMQDSFIFSGDIEDNIRYGKLDATREEIVKASRTVCADEFISKMPDRYQTEVRERGSMRQPRVSTCRPRKHCRLASMRC